MLLLIDALQTAIYNQKDLSSLSLVSNKELAVLNRIFDSGLPKLTLSQNLFEVGNRLIARFHPTYPKTAHSKNKELIAEILGGDIYHIAKVKGYMENNRKNLSSLEFTRLKRRCDKIRSPQILLGAFAEILEQRKVPLLKSKQLEILLSSSPHLKNSIDKGVEAFKRFKEENPTIQLKLGISLKEEQLFVIQTLYEKHSPSNITSQKWDKMDKSEREIFFSMIAEGNIKHHLDKRSEFEKSLFTEGVTKETIEQMKNSIFQFAKEDIYCLEYSLKQPI